MKVTKILKRASLATAVIACSSSLSHLSAQTVYSKIVGAMAITVEASSDAYVTPSFANSAVFRGTVASSVAGTSVTLSSGTFTLDQFAGANLLLESGAGSLDGRIFEITANSTSGVLTVVDSGNELTGIANATVAIIPDITLGGLFPNGIGGTSEANPGDPDVVLFTNDNTDSSSGFHPSAFYYFAKGAEDTAKWRKVGAALDADFNSQELPLGEGLVVRNNTASAKTFYVFGEVLEGKFSIPLRSFADKDNYNYIGVPRPLDIALTDLDLAGTAAFANNVDKLLVFPASVAGQKNVEPDEYIYDGTAWRKNGNNAVDAGSDVIPASAGIAIFKPQGTPGVVYWTENWSVDQL